LGRSRVKVPQSRVCRQRHLQSLFEKPPRDLSVNCSHRSFCHGTLARALNYWGEALAVHTAADRTLARATKFWMVAPYGWVGLISEDGRKNSCQQRLYQVNFRSII